MLEQVDRLSKQVLEIVREEDTCRRLMSVPGVGPITAPADRGGPRNPGSELRLVRELRRTDRVAGKRKRDSAEFKAKVALEAVSH